MRSMSISYNTYYNVDGHGDRGTMFAGKNVFTNVGSEKIKRRPSQVDRAVHRLYAEPRQVFSNRLADQILKRSYWALRALQYKIFYKSEELDTEEVLENWELGIKPPPLEEMARTSHFDTKWLKYMYAKFKNECPSGRMKEPEFRTLLESILPHGQATDQYVSRMFRAFSNEDQKILTFQNLIECLSHLHPETAETRARWTVRLITGNGASYFTFPEFLSFTKSVFALSECQKCDYGSNRESPLQRAEAVFRDLDSNGDGLVSEQDMIRFFNERRFLLEDSDSCCSSCYRTPVKVLPCNGK